MKSTNLRSVFFLFSLAAILTGLCGCKEAKREKPPSFRKLAVDSSAYRLDSGMVEKFFREHPLFSSQQQNILSFYRGRGFTAAWVSQTGVNEYAGHFLNLLNHEKFMHHGDSVIFRPALTSAYQKQAFEATRIRNDSIAFELEMLLTLNFFEYARRNWGGVSDETLKKVRWFIERKQLDYSEVLSSFLHGDASAPLRGPVNPQYDLLRAYLDRYAAAEKADRWPGISDDKIKLKTGDSSALVPAIKHRLFLLGDLAQADSSLLFDSLLDEAVHHFQERHGLQTDGVIGGQTLKELGLSFGERIRQILINLERSRWVPARYHGDYLVVNIPEFMLHVYASDSLSWSCKAIVGKSDDPVFNTIIFNDSLEYVVFSPYWNIPKNILQRETLPAIRKNRSYLKRNNLEVVDRQGNKVNTIFMNWQQYTDHFPYIIREKPGPNNSLGLVKFLFPNPYDIYMHDTPAKELFKKNKRDFSHGCIRIEEPSRLARFLLRNDSSWTPEKIAQYMHGGKETFIRIKKKVPVFIAYFTAWVDREGRLNFRQDVYGHDLKMKNLLFVN